MPDDATPISEIRKSSLGCKVQDWSDGTTRCETCGDMWFWEEESDDE